MPICNLFVKKRDLRENDQNLYKSEWKPAFLFKGKTLPTCYFRNKKIAILNYLHCIDFSEPMMPPQQPMYPPSNPPPPSNQGYPPAPGPYGKKLF